MSDESSLYAVALHPDTCQGRPEDILEMQSIVSLDPDAIHRLQPTQSDSMAKVYPLHQACQQLHLDCVKFLINNGACVDFQASDTSNAISCTIFGHNLDKNDPKCYQIVEELLKNKNPNSNIYKFDDKVESDFLELIKLNLNYFIKLLLEYNELHENMLPENDFPKHYNTSFSAITCALIKKNIDAAKLFVMHGDPIVNYTRHSHKFFGVPTTLIKIFRETDELLRALRIFHVFGGNLWTNHVHVIDRVERNALEFIRDCPSMQARYPGIEEILEKMMSNPLTLKEQCRLSLWRHHGRDYWKYAKSIKTQDVPVDIKDYLNLDDL